MRGKEEKLRKKIFDKKQKASEDDYQLNVWKFLNDGNIFRRIGGFFNKFSKGSLLLFRWGRNCFFLAISLNLWYNWSQGFCLIGVGGAPIEVLRQYIESQGK